MNEGQNSFERSAVATVSREEYERVCAQRDKLRILALELATKQGYTWEEAERLMYPQPEKPASAASASEHAHEWSALWSHFGEYGDQDAHYHVCLTENEHPAPGYATQDCHAMLVGKGRDCVDGAEHEVRLPARRVRR